MDDYILKYLSCMTRIRVFLLHNIPVWNSIYQGTTSSCITYVFYTVNRPILITSVLIITVYFNQYIDRFTKFYPRENWFRQLHLLNHTNLPRAAIFSCELYFVLLNEELTLSDSYKHIHAVYFRKKY